MVVGSDEEMVLGRADDVGDSAVVVIEDKDVEVTREGVDVALAVLVVFTLALVVDVAIGTTSSAELVAVATEVNGLRRLLRALSRGSNRKDMMRRAVEYPCRGSWVSNCSVIAKESLHNPVTI